MQWVNTYYELNVKSLEKQNVFVIIVFINIAAGVISWLTCCKPNILRIMRGVIYIFVGISSGFPWYYFSYINQKYGNFNLSFLYIGGILYVIGALFYVSRIP